MFLGQGQVLPGSWLLMLRAHMNLQNCLIRSKAIVQVREGYIVKIDSKGQQDGKGACSQT